MDVSLILKMAGIGITVTAVCHTLSRLGREEQSTYVSIAGIIVALLVLVGSLGELFDEIRAVFMI